VLPRRWWEAGAVLMLLRIGCFALSHHVAVPLRCALRCVFFLAPPSVCYFNFFSSESCRSEQFLIYFDFINDGAALCP
jgi:hypothetical protein